MADAGSVSEKVKQQADIVRVVGEYVRLKKTGKDFSGLCPFHQEKTPSFTVSPIKQIFYCFGCGKGGDVFNFVMEMEKCEFREALKIVAEKCGISLPRSRERSPEERKESQQRSQLLEMHREAQAYFVKQLEGTQEGKAARAYLEDRGLDKKAIERFGIGYALSGGDALLRQMRPKYDENLLEASGLISRDQSGNRLFDRFRRRITFPISNESGKIVAFGCRALGDDQPKYLNSPETPIYSKSSILYNFYRAKETLLRRKDYERCAVLVEGYLDCIRVDSAGLPNVVASCGTSLTENHARLLKRIAPRVVVWYDMDSAGRSATDRSLEILLAQELDVEVYPSYGAQATSTKSDPDTYIKSVGADSARAPIEKFIAEIRASAEIREANDEFTNEVRKISTPFAEERLQRESELRQKRAEKISRASEQVKASPSRILTYRDFLMKRVTELFDVSTSGGKIEAVNFLLPHVQRASNGLLRSEWATRIAQQLHIEEPVLRAALSKAAKERRGEVKLQPELVRSTARPAERRLIRMLAEADGFRRELAQVLQASQLYHGLETEKIFAALIVASLSSDPFHASEIGAMLEDRERRLFFEILFEDCQEPSWDEAQSCLDTLTRKRLERELSEVQRGIEANPSGQALRELLTRKQELMRRLAASA